MIALRRPKDALEIIQRGLTLYPNQLKLLIVATDACRALGDSEKSLEFSELLITHHPDNFQGYGRAAQDLLKLVRLDDAIEKVQAGLIKNPNQLNLLMIATDICRASGNYKKSLEYAELLIAHHPDNIQGYGRATQDLIKLKRLDDAMEKIQTGLERFPDNFNLLTIAIDAFRRSKKINNSLCFANTLISKHPANPVGYIRASEDLITMNRLEDAINQIHIGLEKFPDHNLLRQLKSKLPHPEKSSIALDHKSQANSNA